MKLFKKLSLLFLPVLAYFIIFWIFEPYNYFGVKNFKNANGEVIENTNSPIYRVRNYEREPKSAIILGDSRMAHFDLDLVKKVSGKDFSSLAFGGASLGEAIDMFYYAYDEAESQNVKIDTVCFGVSFYTLRANYTLNRIDNINTIVTNPLAYMTNFDYNIEMLNLIMPTIRGDYTGEESETATWTDVDYLDENGNTLPFRKNLMDYAEGSIYPQCENYELNEKDLARLVELSAFCDKNSIDLTFVFPPMDDSLKELVIKPLGIEDKLSIAVDTLNSTNATVLDYELTLDDNLTEKQFFDGFHIDWVHGMPQFTQELFSHFR